MNQRLFIIPTVLFMSFGCETAKDNQKDAIQAQQQANEKIAEVRSEARDQVVNAQAKAAVGVAEAQANYEKLREDFRHDINTKLVALDEKISKAEAKASKEAGEARANLTAKLAALRTRRAEFAANFEALKDTNVNTWDSAKLSELDKFADRAIE
jgi:regulator of protease activity HflC (stomatin/prohibitin superfamily)